MKVVSETGLYGRMTIGLTAAGLAVAVISFLPSPMGLLDLFQPIPVVDVKPVPDLQIAAVPPLAVYDVVSERPLFNPGRLADPEVEAPGRPSSTPALGDLSQFRLVGLVGDSITQLALIQKIGGKLATVKPGDTLEGWRVLQIGPKGVSISGGGRKEFLTIPKAANNGKSP